MRKPLAAKSHVRMTLIFVMPSFLKKKKNLIFKPFSVHTQIQPVLLERVFLTSSVVVTED